MAYNGSGVFTRLYNWVTDKANGIFILASRMDAEMDGFATGLSQVITRNGESTTTNRIPFAAGIGVAGGDVAAPSINWTSDPDSGFYRIGENNLGLTLGGIKVWDFGAAGSTLTGTLTVTGNVTFQAGFTLAGTFAVSSLSVSGNATVGGTLGVTGAATFGGTGVFTGTVSAANPTAGNHTLTRDFADARYAAAGGSIDPTLTALALLDGTTGQLTQTGVDTFVKRVLAAGSGRITISNPAGTGGNPTFDVNEGALNLNSIGGTLPIEKGGTGATTQAGAQTNLGISPAAAFAEATVAEIRNVTPDKLLVTDTLYAAADIVALTDGATVNWDMNTGINFIVTLAGNRALANPTNTKVGKSGVLIVNQDGTGTRTLSFGANFEFAGGIPSTLTATASAKDVFSYFVQSATSIILSPLKAVS